MDRTALRQILLNLLQEEKVTVYDSLEDDLNLRDGLGLDSIDVVDLVVNIQNRFHIEFQSEELEQIVKIGDLLDMVQTKLSRSRKAA